MMQINYPAKIILCLSLLIACRNNDRPAGKSENDIDAARTFIRAALDGKFEEARTYLFTDSINTNWMDVAERSYRKTDDETKRGYRSSSINIHQVNQVNDSTTVVIYSNSFKNDHDTLKVLKQNGQWLVDLKYLYDHDMDTLQTNKIIRDSIR
jgi:hypothetical protein